jgi:hypothetical protein
MKRNCSFLASIVIIAFCELATGEEPQQELNAAVDSALNTDDFDHAIELLSSSRQSAVKAQDKKLIESLDKRIQALTVQKASFERIKLSIQKLFESPDDPEANLAVGRYYCFLKNAWEKGLPLLAKGADPKLSIAAKLDIEASNALAEQQAVVADKWWEVAEKMPTTEQEVVKLHAAGWYGKAFPSAILDTKAKIEKRLFGMPVPLINGSMARTGVSPETTKALPTKEELEKFHEDGIASRNGERDRLFKAGDRHKEIQLRLGASPELWTEEDFRLRCDAAAKLTDVFNAEFSGHSASDFYKSLSNYIAAAPSSDQIVQRLQAVERFRIDRLKRQGIGPCSCTAINKYIIANSTVYSNPIFVRKFCEWIKSQGISDAGIDEYIKDLPSASLPANAESSGPKMQNRIAITADGIEGTYSVFDKSGKSLGKMELRKNGGIKNVKGESKYAYHWSITAEGNLLLKWANDSETYSKAPNGNLYNITRESNYCLVKDK